MTKLLVTILSGAILAGCGGGSGGDSVPTPVPTPVPVPTPEPTPTPSVVDVNGLFKNQAGTASLLVDTQNKIVNVFDDTSTIYDVDQVSYSTGNIVNLTGLTVISSNSWDNAPEEQGTLTYSEDGQTATFEYTDGKETYTEVFNRQPNSLPIADFTGSYMSALDSGVEWIINGDGSVNVNSVCTLSGNLEPVKSYYNLTVTATGCAPEYSAYENSTFTGGAYTIEYQGKQHLIGMAFSSEENYVIWDAISID